jgi:hypothetical protein
MATSFDHDMGRRGGFKLPLAVAAAVEDATGTKFKNLTLLGGIFFKVGDRWTY